MKPDWTLLDAELARWAAAGLTLPVWWRDDDAVAPSDALGRLAALSGQLRLPVHLAVIPAAAEPALAQVVAAHPQLIPVVHGWAHRNHAPEGAKKAEFGDHRPPDRMRAEARAGLQRLRDLFGAALRPMFVPPWNRVAPGLVPALPDLGFAMLSTFTPRKAAEAAPGLAQINTHLDPIDWRGSRSLADPATLIAQIAAQLADRRLGHTDRDEPYGILTHHLVHDAAIWDFTAALLGRLMAGPTRPWTAPPQPKDETT